MFNIARGIKPISTRLFHQTLFTYFLLRTWTIKAMTLGSLHYPDVAISFSFVNNQTNLLSQIQQRAPQVKALLQVRAGSGELKQIWARSNKNCIYTFSHEQIKLYCTKELQKYSLIRKSILHFFGSCKRLSCVDIKNNTH